MFGNCPRALPELPQKPGIISGGHGEVREDSNEGMFGGRLEEEKEKDKLGMKIPWRTSDCVRYTRGYFCVLA